MPTYEYQCRKCGHRFDEFQRITDPPVKDCPKCHRRNCIEQLISGGSGLIFKGSGFYITDYRKDARSFDAESASKGESASKSSGPDTKSDPGKS